MKEGEGFFWLPPITLQKMCGAATVAGFARLPSCCHRTDNRGIPGADSDNGRRGAAVCGKEAAMGLFLEGY